MLFIAYGWAGQQNDSKWQRTGLVDAILVYIWTWLCTPIVSLLLLTG